MLITSNLPVTAPDRRPLPVRPLRLTMDVASRKTSGTCTGEDSPPLAAAVLPALTSASQALRYLLVISAFQSPSSWSHVMRRESQLQRKLLNKHEAISFGEKKKKDYFSLFFSLVAFFDSQALEFRGA